MLELFRIAGRIDLEGTENAERALERVDNQAGKTGSKLGGFAKKVGAAGALVGGAMAGAGAAAFAMTEKLTSGFDKISKGAQRVGVSTDFFQEMDFWATQNGLSHDKMEKAVGRLNQRIGLAAQGNEKYSGALESLGISMDEVRSGSLSTEEAMARSIQSLANIEDSHEQAALATELFGVKLARDLLPSLQDGALSIDDARAKAEELGIVIGEDSLSAGVLFQDTWDRLTRTFTAVSQKILAELMPVFQSLMDWVLAHMPQIQSVFQTVFNVINTVFSTLVTGIQFVISWLQTFADDNKETFTTIWRTIQDTFNQVVSFLQKAWENIKKFWAENGQAILDNAKRIFESIWQTVETIFIAVKDIIEQVIGYIVPWVQEKLKVLQKFWQDNGQQIMQAVQNAFAFIRAVIETVMPIIQRVIKAAWDIISSVFDAAVGIIMGIVKTLASLLTGDFEGIKEGLTRIWESLWNGIKGVVEGAWSLLSDAFSILWDAISGWFKGLVSDAKQWGSDIIQGMINGISNMKDAIVNKVEEVVGSVADTVKDYFGIASPSKLMTDYGENIGDGLIAGMTNKVNAVGETASKLAMAVTEPLRSIGEVVSSVSSSLSRYAPRDGGFTIGPDGKLSGGASGGSSSRGKGKLVDKDGDGRMDYKEYADGSKTHYSYHDGGWVSKFGSMFNNLKNDEVPAILQTGEFVLSRKMVDNFANSQAKGDINQYITIQSPQPLSASETARKYKQASRQLAMEWGL